MRGLPVSIAGVVREYADFIDLLIADKLDSGFGVQVEGMPVRYANTLMKSEADKKALAQSVLEFLKMRPVEAAAC